MAGGRTCIGASLLALLVLLTGRTADGACRIPTLYAGDWYSMEAGADVGTVVNDQLWGEMNCVDMKIHPNSFNVTGLNSTMLMNKPGSNCMRCLDVLWRTPNILQYRQSDCFTNNLGIEQMCTGYSNLPGVDQLITMFRQTLKTVNCITTFEGIYRFTYEVSWGGGGICDNPESEIKACQDPGSAYVDNEVFLMSYARCPEVQTSHSDTVRYQCMGSWFAMLGTGSSMAGYTFAAIADTVEKDRRERFKCLMTLKNQKSADNSIRWVMSRFADCSSLNSIYDGPTRLVLHLKAPTSNYKVPLCNLPRNMSGVWYTQGVQYPSQVTVNDTHIIYETKKNEFEFEKTILTCQQTLGTRYMMTKIIEGKCEVDFVCYDLMPRHHGIVRYRTGKPSRLTTEEMSNTDFLTYKFREACSWTSFTFNRDDTDWKYEVLILNPPTPVPCPIAGRYQFTQLAINDLEQYSTKIRGVTERPRVQIDCRNFVSELKSCSEDKSTIEVDASYCESVDYRGRPVGEYEEPDNYLTCVGYWMEDMKSYLITYDEEDPISQFRCWVYARTGWTTLGMSRAQTARCPREQDSTTYDMDGVGLYLELSENERLYDDCPQRFDPGIDPYRKPTVIYILNSSPRLLSQPAALVLVLCATFLRHLL